MFLSASDDMTIFLFEISVEDKQGDPFIVNKEKYTWVRSAYTSDTLTANNQRRIRICYSITSNAFGNAAPFYATVYGLSKEESPAAACPSGIYSTPPLLDFCYGGCQDITSTIEGHLLFFEAHTNLTKYSLTKSTILSIEPIFSCPSSKRHKTIIHGEKVGMEDMTLMTKMYGLSGR